MWYLSHKLELALEDAFKDKELDKKAQEQLFSEFYLFKKATLKWRLFKKYGKITGQEALRYKWGEITRWVTHQLATIDVHICNLATLLAFANEQIETPYNSTMKSERSHLEGIGKAACNLPLLLYQCLQRNVFGLCCTMFFGFGKSITFTSRSYYYHRNSLTHNFQTG